MKDFDDAVLDEKDPFLSNRTLMDYIAWWERGRIFYNLTLMVAYGIAIVTNWYNALNMGWGELGLWLLIYTFVANVFYTMAWAVVMLRLYYFKKESQFLFRNKVWIWLLGTILSGGWLYHVIASYLENWEPFVFFEF